MFCALLLCSAEARTLAAAVSLAAAAAVVVVIRVYLQGDP